MSFPDTEDRAKEVERVAPLAAERLRQYANLSGTQEATIEEMRAAIAQLNATLAAANLRLGEYARQATAWRELPEVKTRLIAEAEQKKAEAEAALAELTAVAPIVAEEK